MLLAVNGSVGFLRGLLTNLGTPPVTSDIRSILVRPRLRKPVSCDRIAAPQSLIIPSTTGRSSRFGRDLYILSPTHGPVDVTLGVLLLQRLALVERLAPPGEVDLDLGDPLLEVQ